MKIDEKIYEILNINSVVKFKLTKEGHEILKKYDEEVNYGMAKCGMSPLNLERVFNKDGYYELQLWNLMEIFGEWCSIAKNSPFEKCNIYIKSYDLEKESD